MYAVKECVGGVNGGRREEDGEGREGGGGREKGIRGNLEPSNP